MRPFEIIIPHLRDQAKLEDTLVSVLQHQPDQCHVSVVHPGEYDDPYRLHDEGVRFLSAAGSATLTDLIELGVDRARCEILHVLEPGMEVTDGWSNAALEHFSLPEVAAVAPLILEPKSSDVVVSAGLQFSHNGHHKPARCGATYKPQRRFRASIVGPHWSAAFYRRSALQPLLKCGCVVGDKLADLDWALQFADQGLRCMSEARSHVHGKPADANLKTFSDGRHAQRLFLRHAAKHGSWLWHPTAWLLNMLETLPSLATLALPLGRLAACFEPRHKRTPRDLPEAAAQSFDDGESLRRAA